MLEFRHFKPFRLLKNKRHARKMIYAHEGESERERAIITKEIFTCQVLKPAHHPSTLLPVLVHLAKVTCLSGDRCRVFLAVRRQRNRTSPFLLLLLTQLLTVVCRKQLSEVLGLRSFA